MKRISAKLSYANVMATFAVFLALGGAAYAATKLPKNSVGTMQIKKGAVTPPKLSKAAKATLTGATGSQGPKGEKGLTGEAGSALAYARIEANGTLDTAHSKNITSSSLSSITGVYCVTPSVPVTSVVVSTPHTAGDTGTFSQANIIANGDDSTTACTTPVWVAIRNRAETNEDHPFYLVFN
jgi:hypothetical protein